MDSFETIDLSRNSLIAARHEGHFAVVALAVSQFARQRTLRMEVGGFEGTEAVKRPSLHQQSMRRGPVKRFARACRALAGGGRGWLPERRGRLVGLGTRSKPQMVGT